MAKKLVLVIFALIMLSMSVSATTILSFNLDTTVTTDSASVAQQIVEGSSVVLQINTDRPAVCKYSQTKGLPYAAMSGVFDFNFDTISKETLTDLSDGSYKYYIRCRNNSNSDSGELEVSFAVNVPVSAEIRLTEGSPVKAGRVEVKLTTSKIVSQTPSLSYSFDGVSYSPIPLFGAETQWTGYIIITNTEENEVGSFRFQGRDLEGVIGTVITSGGIFLVDTQKPETITNIKSEGFEGKIELTWHSPNSQEVTKFNIYRSTTAGADYSDYYKSVSVEKYTDTSVDRGKTYYYRVTSVDAAGNEAELSPEVYSTVLLKDTVVTASGLEARFLGVVDSSILEIESVTNSIDEIRENFNRKESKEEKIIEDLKLLRELDTAKNELTALKRELESYKSQNLDKNELDKKLNAARLKLTLIKKKVPESLVINKEKKENIEIAEEEIRGLILKLKPTFSEKNIENNLEKAMQLNADTGFKLKREGYVLEVIYLDGTSKKMTLVKEIVDALFTDERNASLMEDLPKEIVDSVSEVDIKNVGYEVVKDDAIISFDKNTKEIVYVIHKEIDLNLLKDIKTILIGDLTEETKKSGFTGYAVFADLSNLESYFGLIIGIIILIVLGAYFYLLKSKSEKMEKTKFLRSRIAQAQRKIEQGDIEGVKKVYQSLSNEYKLLDKEEKKIVFSELNELHKKIILVIEQ